MKLAQHLDAERAIVGCLLYSSDLMADVSPIIDLGDFTEPFFRDVFAAIEKLQAERSSVDIVTVSGLLDRATYPDLLPRLTETMSYGTPSNVTSYAVQIATAARRNRLARLAAKVGSDIETGVALDDVIAEAQVQLLEVTTSGNDISIASAGAVAADVVAKVRARSLMPTDVPGLPTGMHELDLVLGGLEPGRLYLLAARPGHGKSAAASQWAVHLAEGGSKVLFFSMEMSDEEVVERMLSHRAGVWGSRMKTGRLDQSELDRLSFASDELHEWPLDIIDEGRLDVDRLCLEVRRRSLRGDVDVVIVDYLQLLARANSDPTMIGDISRSLKVLAKETNVAVVALSQLSREPLRRLSQRPNLGDLRGSGSLEQDADAVVFVYNLAVAEPDSNPGNRTDFIVAKNRQGRANEVDLTYAFIGEVMTFAELI